MWWTIVIIAVLVVAVWGVVGSAFPATGSNGSTAPSGQGCDACKGLDAWFGSLTFWKKMYERPFYTWKRFDCWVKKCPT
jgi:hypothetical protein